MKTKYFIKVTSFLIVSFLLLSCEDFVEVEAPDNKLVQGAVFSSDDTAKGAMTGIYNQLFQSEFSGGHFSSVTLLSGLSGNNIKNLSTYFPEWMEFEQHELQPGNSNVLYLWSSAYNIIYMCNAMLEGLYDSNSISPALKQQLEGEVRFIRAFSYFYLINLYGDVPLILSTNYQENYLAPRDPVAEVYLQIVEDLKVASELLSSEYRNGERTEVNSYAATALLSRVHLYLENWEQAEILSTRVIEENSKYQLPYDLNDVFLANSKEAIWQISPIGGGGFMTQTNEGSLFVIDPVYYYSAFFQLDDKFPEVLEETDKRMMNWIGYNPERDAFFPFKYQIQYSSSFPITEYSMVLRLAEQYLIRAEARARTGNLTGSIEDLDILRDRAGLPLVAETDPSINQEGLLDLIFEERRKELFAEWGHRWFDLKRSARAGEVLGANNPLWQSTDLLYPIPEEERKKNPNLSQNPGY